MSSTVANHQRSDANLTKGALAMYQAFSAAQRWIHVLGAPVGLGITLLLLPVSASAASPNTWHVGVGTQGFDEAVQGNVFLTQQITVDAGDTVDWTINSGEPHTVTFLFGAKAPSPFAPGIGPGSVTIPSPSAGQPIVNTGILSPGQNFSATFAEPGTYAYVCLLHAGMAGSVVVNPAATPYPHQRGFYAERSARESFQILSKGLDLWFRGLLSALEGGPKQVTAGIGASLTPRFSGDVFVPRFLPGQRIVHTGDTVTWTNLDPATPHTVTIGTEPTVLSATVGSTTVTTAPNATTLSSGFIGAGFPVGKAFALTFDHAGTYSYYCDLHDDLGMRGTIVVLP